METGWETHRTGEKKNDCYTEVRILDSPIKLLRCRLPIPQYFGITVHNQENYWTIIPLLSFTFLNHSLLLQKCQDFQQILDIFLS